MWSSPSIVLKAMRYVLTGGAAAVVDAVGFISLQAAGIAAGPAAALSFCLAAVINYGLTSRYVFRSALSSQRCAMYFAFAVVGLGINVGATVLLIEVAGLPPYLGKIGGIGFAFFANFAMNIGFVFRDRASMESAT